MSVPPIPEPGWVITLLRLADRAIARTRINRCGHHWHPNLPIGPGAHTTWTCCACPGRHHARPPKTSGGRECTRYTP